MPPPDDICWLRVHPPDQTPAKYNCQKWQQVLKRSKQFEVKTDSDLVTGRGQAWFQSRPEDEPESPGTFVPFAIFLVAARTLLVNSREARIYSARPVFQRRIDPRLPAVAAGPECSRHIGRQADGYAVFHHLGGRPSAGLEHVFRRVRTEKLGQHFAGRARAGDLLHRPLRVVVID